MSATERAGQRDEVQAGFDGSRNFLRKRSQASIAPAARIS